MEYKKTINNILKRLEKDFEIVKENDIAETFQTVFLQKGYCNHILINNKKITIPLTASKETKKMLKEENSPILHVYKDLQRGDILLVKEISNNKILVENLSIKEEYRKDFYIDKTDIITKKFNIVKRMTGLMNATLSNLSKN